MARAKIEGTEIEYYMDDRLKNSLDKKVIPSLHKRDKDSVIVIDGREGAGKSTFAMQVGKYVDPSLDLNRVVFSPDAFREAVLRAKKGQCIIYDEAFTGFSSRSSLSPINRVLVSLAMQMRQKNLFVIIVLPTIFLLDKYMALFRTRALLHVYEVKGKRGYFKLYNFKAKKFLIIFGAKTMSYTSKMARTNFRGRFYGKFALGDDKMEEIYRKKKETAIVDSEKNPMTSQQVRFKEQRDILLHLMRKTLNLSYRKMAEWLDEYDIPLSHVQIRAVCGKFGDKDTEEEKKEVEKKEKEENTTESDENKGI